MIRANSPHNAENTMYKQGVNAFYDEINSSVKEQEDKSDVRDEFSSIMDKIAARFSENLGFDYTSLLAGGAAVLKKPEAVKENGKSEKKSEEYSREETVQAESGKFHASNLRKSQEENKSEEKSDKSEKEMKSDEKVDQEIKQTESKVQDSIKETAAQKTQVKSEEKAAVKVTEQNTEVLVKEVKTSEKKTEEVKAEYSEGEKVQAESTEISKEAANTDTVKKYNKAVKQDTTEKAEADVADKTEVNTEAVEAAAADTNQPQEENQQNPETQEAPKDAEANKAAVVKNDSPASLSNAEILTELLLSASFANKDINPAQHSQSPQNSQAIQRISDIIKDKIAGSMNTALNSQGMSMGGSMTSKSSDKAEIMKEKVPFTQPQIFKAMDRVESALKEAAKSRDGKTISLRLDPPELGTVKIDVTLREGSLHARLSADSQTVNTLLREYSHDLQQALRKLGLSVDKVTVSVNNAGEQFEMAQHNNTNSEQKMPDKNSNPGGSAQSMENNFNFIGDTAVQSENNVYDHWVA